MLCLNRFVILAPLPARELREYSKSDSDLSGRLVRARERSESAVVGNSSPGRRPRRSHPLELRTDAVRHPRKDLCEPRRLSIWMELRTKLQTGQKLE